MSEQIFLLHLLALFVMTLFALRQGKEALITLIAFQSVLANLFVLKETVLFGLQVTCSDAYAVGGLLGLNLLREYFGRESALLAIRITFLILLLFGVMGFIHLLYVPSPHDQTHSFFALLLKTTPRLLFASIISYFVAQRVDLALFSFFEKKFPFFIRCGLALLIGQAVDTLFFTLIGLSGMVSSLLEILCFSFLIKVLAILILTPATTLIKKWARIR